MKYQYFSLSYIYTLAEILIFYQHCSHSTHNGWPKVHLWRQNTVWYVLKVWPMVYLLVIVILWVGSCYMDYIIKFITRINKIYSALCNLYVCTCIPNTLHIMVTTCCFKYIHRFVFAFVSYDYIGRFKQISNIFTQTQWIQVIYLSIFFRVISLARGQSNDCPSAIEVTLKNMGKINLYSNTTKHKLYP